MRMSLQRIDRFLTPSEGARWLADPVFRIAVSLIFIIGGLGHFGAHEMMLDRMAESPWRDTIHFIGDPSWLLWLSGVVFVVFGTTLALGLATRLSALVILNPDPNHRDHPLRTWPCRPIVQEYRDHGGAGFFRRPRRRRIRYGPATCGSGKQSCPQPSLRPRPHPLVNRPEGNPSCFSKKSRRPAWPTCPISSGPAGRRQ
jgi:hypothetical protein